MIGQRHTHAHNSHNSQNCTNAHVWLASCVEPQNETAYAQFAECAELTGQRTGARTAIRCPRSPTHNSHNPQKAATEKLLIAKGTAAAQESAP